MAGVAGFALALLVHGAKVGFAVILDRAMDRTAGVGPVGVGQFASSGGAKESSYEFPLWQRAVAVPGDRNCYYAQQKDADPIGRLEFGLRRDGRVAWHREATPAGR